MKRRGGGQIRSTTGVVTINFFLQYDLVAITIVLQDMCNRRRESVKVTGNQVVWSYPW